MTGHRVHALRDALNRALARVDYCRRNVDTYAADADLSDPYRARHLRKLQTDLQKSEIDAAWFRHQVDQAISVVGVWEAD